jgi:VanZ family protein
MMVAIFALSSIPSDSMPSFDLWDTLIKKGGHFIGYGILAIAYLFWIGKNDRKTVVISFLLTGLYAVSDEFHQTLVPGRNGSILDVLIDGSGALTALWIVSKTKLFREA